MDISAEVLQGLSLLSESRQRLSDDDFKRMLETVSRSMVWQSGDKQQLADDMSRGEEKMSCLSLISLLVTAARLNAGIQDEISRIRDVLSDCEVSKQRIELIISVYEKDRQRLQERLSSLSLNDQMMPAFRDIRWTQEVVLKSNTLERMQSLQYLICLKHESGSTDMCANVDDLQEMVHRLRECCKAIDTIKQQSHQK